VKAARAVQPFLDFFGPGFELLNTEHIGFLPR